ncbi:MAG: CCA tRNA nucleotidyltransferase [Alphaproteobacteria bacterium]|nr:CCA tRNA nucleotidyltransferase [Alphaproteobacteria bacterium]
MTYPWLHWPETKTLIAAFDAARVDIRFVGGAVRDSLLGREVVEVDAATPATPEAVIALLEAANIRAIPTGLAHGTVTALVDKKPFEITTLRKDISTDGRHAVVAFTDDWKEDAQRRDFTMNALYFSPSGELFDYFGGQEDARAGVVRFIGDAGERIAEDYLRILRFFRFHAHYGRGAPDGAALAAISENTAGLQALSGERISHEMLKLFSAQQTHKTIALMQVVGANVFPTAVDTQRLERLEELNQAASPLLKLAALVAPDDVSPLATRWKLSGEQKNRLAAWHSSIPPESLTLPAQKVLLRRVGAFMFMDVVYLAAASGAWPEHQAALELAANWQIPKFPVCGEDLMALGMAEGKALGKALSQLENAWEESDYSLSREALLKLIP